MKLEHYKQYYLTVQNFMKWNLNILSIARIKTEIQSQNNVDCSNSSELSTLIYVEMNNSIWLIF